MSEKERDVETLDQFMRITPKSFWSILLGAVLITNSFSIIHQQVLRTADNQQKDREYNKKTNDYNKARADRIANRKLQEAKDYYHLQDLKKELEKCKLNKNN